LNIYHDYIPTPPKIAYSIARSSSSYSGVIIIGLLNSELYACNFSCWTCCVTQSCMPAIWVVQLGVCNLCDSYYVYLDVCHPLLLCSRQQKKGRCEDNITGQYMFLSSWWSFPYL
jgi:hypothetical protein